MIFILFIFWSNYLINLNVAIENHQYQSSLSQDSIEGDHSDLYGRDDDYSDSSGKKTQNGYRQLGLTGNLVNTHSYSNCRPLYDAMDWAYYDCMNANAKIDQQNIIALTAKVLELTKLGQLTKMLQKRLNRLSRRVNREIGYEKSDYKYY